ncbi:MAG TPA: hypothetical protein VMB48_13240 [Steroidobacteraceae bacterium]|nr:hypothetical protein [Steroidobacteraceae bacterium]
MRFEPAGMARATRLARILSRLPDAVGYTLAAACVVLFGALLYTMLPTADLPNTGPLAQDTMADSAGRVLHDRAASMEHQGSTLLADLYLLDSLRLRHTVKLPGTFPMATGSLQRPVLLVLRCTRTGSGVRVCPGANDAQLVP